jgi:hypothetical protein
VTGLKWLILTVSIVSVALAGSGYCKISLCLVQQSQMLSLVSAYCNGQKESLQHPPPRQMHVKQFMQCVEKSTDNSV